MFIFLTISTLIVAVLWPGGVKVGQTITEVALESVRNSQRLKKEYAFGLGVQLVNKSTVSLCLMGRFGCGIQTVASYVGLVFTLKFVVWAWIVLLFTFKFVVFGLEQCIFPTPTPFDSLLASSFLTSVQSPPLPPFSQI